MYWPTGATPAAAGGGLEGVLKGRPKKPLPPLLQATRTTAAKKNIQSRSLVLSIPHHFTLTKVNDKWCTLIKITNDHVGGHRHADYFAMPTAGSRVHPSRRRILLRQIVRGMSPIAPKEQSIRRQ